MSETIAAGWHKRWRRFIDPAIVFLILAILWQEAVHIFSIKRYLLPPLSDVLAAFQVRRG